MDLKDYSKKLVGTDDERAVSPVIGVILMVAITVILAAVIAAFVLDMGQSQTASASAGVEFSEDGGNVTVTFVQDDRTDGNLTVNGDPCNGNNELESVGDQVTCNQTSLTVVAPYEGSNTTVATYEP